MNDILKSLSQTTNGTLALLVSDTLALTSGLEQQITELKTFWRLREHQQIAREKDMVDRCGQLYDAATARDVLSFIEVITTKRSLTIPEREALAKLKKLPSSIQMAMRLGKDSNIVDVTFTGVLSAEARVFPVGPKANEENEPVAA
ncbi:hypothetical protein ACHAPQ_009817 [Fusarium lateritium]